MFSGPMSIAHEMCVLGRPGVTVEEREKAPPNCWENLFIIWWGFSIKFFMPVALVWILFMGIEADI